jgi:hypothetical protein
MPRAGSGVAADVLPGAGPLGYFSGPAKSMFKTLLIKRLGNRGENVVEVTLIFLLLVLLVGAAVDWGLVFLTSHVAQNATREGARWAVTRASLSEAEVEEQVRQRIPDIPLFASFRDSARIEVDCSDSPPVIKITTSGAVPYYFMRIIGLSTVNVQRWASMKYERTDSCPI